MKFFIDVQGTLIDDKEKKPIEGAIEFIKALNKKQVPYIVITNNTKQRDFLCYLQDLGFEISNYIDPLMVLKEVLQQKRVAAYGVEEFIDNIKALGYELDYTLPQAVVLSVKSNYTFEEFADIDEFLLKGAKLYGMHQSSLYVKNSRRYPAVGALLAMFAYATGVGYEVVGKPSKLFFTKALQRVGGKFDEVMIISDDVQGDLIGAAKLGMQTAFVLSGKFKSEQEILPKLGFKPDIVAKNIYEVGKKLGVV